MKPKVPKDLLKKWAQMTSDNDHRRVREDIARWLFLNLDSSFMFYVCMFSTMEYCVHKQQEGQPLPYGFLRSECAITDAMLEEVEKYYDGKKLVEAINKCL